MAKLKKTWKLTKELSGMTFNYISIFHSEIIFSVLSCISCSATQQIFFLDFISFSRFEKGLIILFHRKNSWVSKLVKINEISANVLQVSVKRKNEKKKKNINECLFLKRYMFSNNYLLIRSFTLSDCFVLCCQNAYFWLFDWLLAHLFFFKIKSILSYFVIETITLMYVSIHEYLHQDEVTSVFCEFTGGDRARLGSFLGYISFFHSFFLSFLVSTVFVVVVWILRHINLCRLFYAKSILIQINNSV